MLPTSLNEMAYDSVDTTWWFVKALRDYLEQTFDYEILEEKIQMVHLSDDKEENEKLLKENF